MSEESAGWVGWAVLWGVSGFVNFREPGFWTAVTCAAFVYCALMAWVTRETP